MKSYLTAFAALALAGVLAPPASAQYPGYPFPTAPSGIGSVPPPVAMQQGIPPGYALQQGIPPGYPMQQGIPPGYPMQQGIPPGYAMQQGMPPGYAMQQGMPQATAPAQQSPEDCAECTGDSYGAHPLFKRIFGIKSSCPPAGIRGKIAAHKPSLGIAGWFHDMKKKYGPPSEQEEIPAASGGTLAFPNHPFVRSPRDFFMVEQRP